MVPRRAHSTGLLPLLLAGCSLSFSPTDGRVPHTGIWDTGPGSSVDTTGNLIENGGFEGGEGSWPGVADPWVPVDDSRHDEDSLDTATPYQGDASQCIRTLETWGAGALHQRTGNDTIQPGLAYRLSAWVRTAEVTELEGWFVLGIEWLSADDPVSETRMDPLSTLNYDWSEVVIDVTAPEGVNRAGVVLAALTDGVVCYDEVLFEAR